MATIDRDLVRAINTGRCFAFVGAGPSCEVGLPSWYKLADGAVSLLDPLIHQDCIDKCRQLLLIENYPGVFSEVEKIVNLDVLLDYVKFATVSRNTGAIYSYLARWPFATYLTTNFDDCLCQSLQKEGLVFLTRHNTQEDFRMLRADAKKLIFKIHGDCSTPNDIILTEEQYIAFRSSEERKYWREKIFSALHMLSLVIIGYSATDPDFRDQLERAKSIASPDQPIYLFATGVQIDDIQEYYQRYNIRIIAYNNYDGTHRELLRVLKRYDPFITKRTAAHLGQDPIDINTANIASSMHIFTRLTLAGGDTTCLDKAYAALIAGEIGNHVQGTSVSLGSLQESLSKRIHVQHLDPNILQKALSSLHDRGLIEAGTISNQYSLSLLGREKLNEMQEERNFREEKFSESCRLFLKKQYPNMAPNVIYEVIKQIGLGLVKAFERRGAEMAQATFGQNTLDLSTATDILEVVNAQCGQIQDEDSRSAFADLMLEVLLQPTQEMKERLADLSQGYFSYHALGLDQTCNKERLEIAKQSVWILDSSIILPLLAKFCVNHEWPCPAEC